MVDHGDWEKCLKTGANVTLIFKEDPGNYRPVIFTSISEKVAEQLILETTSRYIKDKEIIWTSQHSFTKRKSCLTNLVNFYNEMTGLVDEVRAVDIVYLDFSTSSF